MTPAEKLFVYWIKERESIRHKRNLGMSKPWTDDPILQSYRFCNVRRADDKVSQWLLTNWYEPYKDHPNMLAAVALARFFNLPATLELIGFPVELDWTKIKRRLRSAKKRGITIYNAAYMVRGNDGQDKIATIIDHTIRPLIKSPPMINTDSMEETWKGLIDRYGFGSFMAGQVVADLRWALTGSWHDRLRWASMGPGSKRGLNRLRNRLITTSVTQSEFNDELLCLIGFCKVHLPEEITNRLEAIDYQNCCCEYDKYLRVKLREGRPKQRYQGGRVGN